MKRNYLFILIALSTVTVSFTRTGKIKSGEALLRKMYKTYKGKWYKEFTFTQTAENYRNDSLIKTATWYEAIVFPDNFRISFGEIKDGNAMIQKGDSTFNFRKGKLFRRSLKGEDLTFLLGGMYFIPFENVISRMVKEGYDVNKFYEGNDAYVLGASSADEKISQLWIDKKKLVVIRFIKYDKDGKQEGIFGDHIRQGKAWTETSCVFYVNDKLVQKETYKDCKISTGVEMAIFDPYNFKY